MIKANSLNSLVYQTCEKILKEGTPLHSRNGLCWELLDVDLYLTNPKARYLYLNGRTNNPFATLFETIWVFAGYSHLDELLHFIPRAKNYSDDGKTWRGAYGTRVYNHKQIDSVLELFTNEGLNTRRAVMTIWQPELDTQESIRKQGFQSSKDIPCSQWLGFWVRDNKLYLKFQMRSNDVIFGFSHINVFEFTTLQELVRFMLENRLNKKLGLGYYHHSVISLHLYDFSRKQAEVILSDPTNHHNLLPSRTKPLIADELRITIQDELKELFQDLYDYVVGEGHDIIYPIICGMSDQSELFWWAVFSRLYWVYKEDKSKLISLGKELAQSCHNVGHEELAKSVFHYLKRLESKLGGGR